MRVIKCFRPGEGRLDYDTIKERTRNSNDILLTNMVKLGFLDEHVEYKGVHKIATRVRTFSLTEKAKGSIDTGTF